MTPDRPEIQRVFQSKSETKAFYDKISHVYDLLAEHSEGPVRRAGLEKLDARPGEKILEIGCGTGHCLVSLAQSVGRTGKVFGLDLSERMFDVARENLQRAGLADRVELSCGDAVQLPHPPDSLDAIFMSFTLELFDTPEIPQVLNECQRVLRPGGRIMVAGFPRRASTASSCVLRVESPALPELGGLPSNLRPSVLEGRWLSHREHGEAK